MADEENIVPSKIGTDHVAIIKFLQRIGQVVPGLLIRTVVGFGVGVLNLEGGSSDRANPRGCRDVDILQSWKGNMQIGFHRQILVSEVGMQFTQPEVGNFHQC